MGKLLSVLTLTLAALVVTPGLAVAGTYGAGEGATVSDTNPEPGEPFSFSASGFETGTTVTITINRHGATIVQAANIVRTVTANTSGAARATITIDLEGSYTITASGRGADGEPLVVSAEVVGDGVAGSNVLSDGGGSTLPRPGAKGIEVQIWAGAGLLLVGATLVALTVRRRQMA